MAAEGKAVPPTRAGARSARAFAVDGPGIARLQSACPWRLCSGTGCPDRNRPSAAERSTTRETGENPVRTRHCKQLHRVLAKPLMGRARRCRADPREGEAASAGMTSCRSDAAASQETGHGHDLFRVLGDGREVAVPGSFAAQYSFLQRSTRSVRHLAVYWDAVSPGDAAPRRSPPCRGMPWRGP